MATEPTHLRFIACPMCKHQFTWLGTRLPVFCPECGKPILIEIKDGKGVFVSDPDASLRYDPARNIDTALHSAILKPDRELTPLPKQTVRPKRTSYGKRQER